MSKSDARQRWVRASDLMLLALLFVVVFLALSPSYTQFMHNPDAGSQLSKGQQILFGFHPWAHVDSSVYGPAIFYLSALAQACSGGRLLPEMLLILGGYLASYLLFFSTFSARSDRRGLLLLFALLALIAFPRFHKYHVLLPQAVFLYSLHRATMISSPVKCAIRLAIGCVIAGVFRIDFGAYCVLASILFLLLRYAPSGTRPCTRAVGVLLATGLLLVSPWLLFLTSAADLGEIAVNSYQMTLGLTDGLKKPLPPYQPALSPLSPDNALILYYWFFMATPLVILAVVFLRWRHPAKAPGGTRKAIGADDLYLLVAAVFATLVNLQASHRIDLSHLKQSLPSSLFVLFLGLAHWCPRMSSMRVAGRSVSLVGIALLCGFLGYGLVDQNLLQREAYSAARWRGTLSSWKLTRSVALEEAIAKPGISALPGVLQRVRQLTTREDAVLFIPYLSQAYYFTRRHFATAFGWWHPGRFRTAGSQQEFIDAMETTGLIVDQPAFSFDQMPERNARAYAPQVMRHIYSTYGLFDVVGGFVFLSREPQIWERHGHYELDLRAQELPAGQEAGRCGSTGYEIHHINTLSITAWERSVSLPHGTGLLLTAEQCADSPRSGGGCPAVGLLAETGLVFVVSSNGRPVSLPRLGPRALIDTRTVPPGKYRLVQLPCPTSQVPTRPLGLAPYETSSVTVTLREPPRH